MSRKRTDRLCVRMNLCVNNEINDAIECFQLAERLKKNKLSKAESGEKYFEMLHEFYKEHQKQMA